MMKDHSITFWQLADQLNVDRQELARWMFYRLDWDKQQRVRRAINEILTARNIKASRHGPLDPDQGESLPEVGNQELP